MKKQRSSGIELLRVIAMFGVIMIHYYESLQNYELSANSSTLLLLFRSCASSAVNLFIIISGYFLIYTDNRKLGKSISLLIQISLFSELSYLLSTAYGLYDFSIKSVFSSLISKNYFATLYIVLFFISPYINQILRQLNPRDLKVMICVLFCIFSVYSIAITLFSEVVNVSWFGLNPVGAWGSQQGFNIVNFVLLYILGAYIRLSGIDIRLNKKMSISIYFVSTIFIFLWAVANQYLHSFGQISAWCYDNPLVIIQGLSLFVLFKKFPFSSRIINRLAPASFTTFLLHFILLSKFESILFYDNIDSISIICRYFCFAISVYWVSWIIYESYNLLTKGLINRIDCIKILYFTNNDDSNILN